MLVSDLAHAAADKQDIAQIGSVSRYTLPVAASQGSALDYANARAMPLSQAPSAPPSPLQALLSPAAPPQIAPPQIKPSYSSGAVGSGKQSPVVLVPAKPEAEASAGGAPEAFGSPNQPFTTSRVNVVGRGDRPFSGSTPSRQRRCLPMQRLRLYQIG